MAKRNAKREPVKPVESDSDKDELEELHLDSDDADSDVDADADGEDETDEEAGTASDAGEDDEIEDAMLELMAAQAERAQRRAAARATASEGDEPDERPQPSTRTVGKSRMAAAAAAADGAKGGDLPDDAAAATTTAAVTEAEAGESSDDGEDGGGRLPDPGSDSSEDERPNRNTVGAVPLEWYKDEEHIGYDVEGRRIGRTARKDKLQQLLDRNDSKKALRTIYDPYNDEEIQLSREELAMVMRIRNGQFPHVEVNPFEPYNDYFSREREVMPIVDRPEPKSRFVPSKWEEKKIVKLVRAIRKGWIRVGPQQPPRDPEDQEQVPPAYLLWADDGTAEGGEAFGKSGSGLTYIPAPKPQLPGHADSYNPPAEYLPTEEEVSAWQLADPEDRPRHLPTAFPSLRTVPAYADFIKERFERCLDLYLCPRIRRKRLDVKPEALVPQLPRPRDLQPFPTSLAVVYEGHVGAVNSIAADPWDGQWLLSGGQDGTIRLWEVRSGRCWRSWQLGAGPVAAVAWCPNPALRLVSAAVGSSVVLLHSGTGPEEAEAAAEEALRVASTSGRDAGGNVDVGGGDGDGGGGPQSGELSVWRPRSGPGGGLEVRLRFPVQSLSWHSRGDYFASVAPAGNTQAVVVHQLSRGASQNPFRKNRGRVVRVAFHPSKPFFFVATQNHVRVYNLAKQALAKKLIGGGGSISCLAVHPSGDHVLVGSDDKRVAWYDMDLSTKPYKALRYHQQPPRSVAFHRSYPLFASSSDDGTVQVFHGMVYSDLLTNPLIVPVKILRGGHSPVVRGGTEGVTDCAFHPTQPWIFTAGADAKILLYCN
ncbi:Ribosome bioproteinsis protein 1 [Pleodorina starrii]|uniref:Ribosome biogenesis protein BOP1 homolog n=1 Tax=Pleodorina starrii TaxID=330485 RepID=A0A9W6BHV6_9CHLO|nr:Ribosome bioproteinsis protein 1 [Pleodorina starrii]GLC52359.1 Ribosome bioproteinsis protein 1 [Pleodorina starrii]